MTSLPLAGGHRAVKMVGDSRCREGLSAMSSRTLNLKRWVILIGVLSVIAVALFLIQRFQVSRLARSVAQEADSAVDKGNFEKATKLYGQHLSVVPDDAEIQIKY